MNHLAELEKIRNDLLNYYLVLREFGEYLAAEYVYEEFAAIQKSINKIKCIQKHARKTMGDLVAAEQVENSRRKVENNVM